MIDHAEARELLELAAVEPGGLDRLAAGDTPEAVAVAGHLVGCPTCSDEARRLAIAAPVIAETVRALPPEELRNRTLAFVREVGRPRSVPGATPATGATPADVPRPARRRFAWPLAAAAVLVAFVAGGLLVGIPLGQQLGAERSRAEDLATLDAATARLAGQGDATRVALVAADGSAGGTIVFSPSTAELVMTASGLSDAPPDRVFSCWIAGPDGKRVRIGQMKIDGGLAYWTGWADELKAAGPGTSFGVTLVDGSGSPVGPGDVLTGVVANG